MKKDTVAMTDEMYNDLEWA